MISRIKAIRRDLIGLFRYFILRMKILDVRVGKHFFVRPNFYLGRGCRLRIGNNVFIGRNGHIACNLTIGDDVMVASSVSFVGGDHRIDNLGDIKIRDSGREHNRETVIHDNVWIGHGAIVLAGVTIESGAVIAAGSVVTQDVGENLIIGGVPAKLIRMRKVN